MRGTYDQQHEIFQYLFKMAVSRDGDCAIDEGSDKCPDESGHGLRPSAHDLQTKCHAVDVGTVIGDDTERKNNKTKLAEAAKWGEENGCEKASNSRCAISLCVGWVVDRGGHNC